MTTRHPATDPATEAGRTGQEARDGGERVPQQHAAPGQSSAERLDMCRPRLGGWEEAIRQLELERGLAAFWGAMLRLDARAAAAPPLAFDYPPSHEKKPTAG